MRRHGRGARAAELRKVDDYPLYELTDTAPTPELRASVDASGWACTVFFGAGGEPIMGRNFDFHDEPALILHHRPPGAYKSVSVVDISYLGFDRKHLDAISAAGLKDAATAAVRRDERARRRGRDGRRAARASRDPGARSARSA